MENINEAPVVAAATKVVAGLAKAGAKAAAKGGKVAAKTSKNVGKAVSKMKRPNIRSYKDPKTGKVNLDKYRSDQAAYKKANKPPTGLPNNSPSRDIGKDVDQSSADRKKEKIDQKVGDAVDATKQRMKDATNLAGKAVKKTGDMARKSVGAVSGGFGSSSFKKESISFQDFIDRIPDIEEEYADE